MNAAALGHYLEMQKVSMKPLCPVLTGITLAVRQYAGEVGSLHTQSLSGAQMFVPWENVSGWRRQHYKQ